MKAFINGIILDGTRDMEPVEGKAILVDGKKIVDIVDTDSVILKDHEVIDLNGKYILPGLINLHVHTAGSGKPAKRKMNLPLICRAMTSCAPMRRIGYGMIAKNMYTALMAGVTTVRTVGGIADFDSGVRDEIRSGRRVGPRMLVADTAVSVEGGHMTGSFSTAVHSTREAEELVDKIAAADPDLIKLMITGGVMDADEIGKPGKMLMPVEYIKAACDRAHELGYPVAAHTEGQEGVKAALENGVDTIEHGAAATEEVCRLFQKTKASQVLTISPAIPFVAQMSGVLGMSDVSVTNSKSLLKDMLQMARKNLENGVMVGLGTDASCSYCLHSGMWRELVYFAEFCRVSPAFALHTATEINAVIAGINDLTGTIAAGKMADMIVVRKDPLKDLTALGKVDMVIMEGTVYAQPDPKKYPEVEDALDRVMTRIKMAKKRSGTTIS